MSQRKALLEVTYHSDDDSGTYHIGEIDFGINGGLENYLRKYGYEGKKNIVGALGYLIYEVERQFRTVNNEAHVSVQCGKADEF